MILISCFCWVFMWYNRSSTAGDTRLHCSREVTEIRASMLTSCQTELTCNLAIMALTLWSGINYWEFDVYPLNGRCQRFYNSSADFVGVWWNINIWNSKMPREQNNKDCLYLLTHLPVVSHICGGELDQHWFREWLKQCCLIVNWIIGNNLQWNSNRNEKCSFMKMLSKQSSAKRRPFCPGRDELLVCVYVAPSGTIIDFNQWKYNTRQLRAGVLIMTKQNTRAIWRKCC